MEFFSWYSIKVFWSFRGKIISPRWKGFGTQKLKAQKKNITFKYLSSFQDTLSCSSWPTSPGLRWEKRWCDLRLIPLLHSRFSQYVPGTDLSRWVHVYGLRLFCLLKKRPFRKPFKHITVCLMILVCFL